MAGDHEDVHKHWWGKYVHKLSAVAESYETKHRWGDETIIRATGEKVWEPMPLVLPPQRTPPFRSPPRHWWQYVEGGTFWMVTDLGGLVHASRDAYVVCGEDAG